ncbi:MAG TPA: type II secretion system F family protein [Anaeromyxobacteraceae bacterium]
MEPIGIAVGLLLVGAVVLAAAGVLSMSARQRAALERRLSGAGAGEAPDVAPERPLPTPGASAAAILARAMAPLALMARPRQGEETTRVALQLSRAGFRGPHAVQLLAGSRMLAALAGLCGFFVLAARSAEPQPLGPTLGVILFAAGYYLPAVWLARRTRQRQSQLERGLPDALDLLVTCVEAGLGLDAAMQRVANELALAHPLLAGELQQTFLEVNAGIRRAEAMRRLAERTGVAELKTLAAILNQTEAFGTSVADALRVQSDGMRVRRMQLAEERAATVPVKLSVPLVLFILPSLFSVILGPAVVNIVRALMPTLQSHR